LINITDNGIDLKISYSMLRRKIFEID